MTAAEQEKGTLDDFRRESGRLFGVLRVLPLQLTIAESDLGKLQKSYTNLPIYVPAGLQEGDRVYRNIGLRLRGVSTFQLVEEKPNFTLKFNEFVSGQKFYGLRKVRLSNAMFDPTYLQELLAWQLFTAAGVAAPRVNFARVHLNGRDLGLYVMIEGITKDFLQLNWGTDRGSVYEADQADIDGPLEQDYGARNRLHSDLRPLVDAVAETNITRRLASLKTALDLDAFSSYVAVEVLMNLWDGYSMRINNYRLFGNHDDRKVYFIPHGLDRTFEEPTDDLLPAWAGKVTHVLLETPATRQLYLARLAELHAKLMVADDLFKRLDDARAVLEPALKELGLDPSQRQALVRLKQRIARRIEVLNESLPPLLSEFGLTMPGK